MEQYPAIAGTLSLIHISVVVSPSSPYPVRVVRPSMSVEETTPETIISYTKDAAGRTIATRRDVGPMLSLIHI